jgi:UDP-N-acetylglucosamine acyltransferase
MTKIHPTAIVDGRAELADDVEIGPGSVVEADVKIGPGTVLRQNVIVRRYTTLGAKNTVDAFTVLGGEPQDLKFDPSTVSYLRIGDGNVFREHVTISRATGQGNATVVGNKTYWMVGTHAGHNATVEDEAILVNGSALAGHSTLGAKAILSAHVVVHQFTWVGTMVMSQGNCATSMHVPPYTIFAGANYVVGLNTIGLRRSPQISIEDRRQIKEAFSLTYRSGLSPARALEKMDACTDWGQAADKYRQFIRRVLTAQKPYNRGLIRLRRRTLSEEEIAS